MGVRGSKLSRLFRVHGVKCLKESPWTPRGYVPVCVGVNNDTKRFVIHTKSLSDADFVELLYRSAEEYGFYNQGILRINYDAKDFEERIIKRARGKSLKVQTNLAVETM